MSDLNRLLQCIEKLLEERRKWRFMVRFGLILLFIVLGTSALFQELESRERNKSQRFEQKLLSTALLQLPEVYTFHQLLPNSTLTKSPESENYSFISSLNETPEGLHFYSCQLPQFILTNETIEFSGKPQFFINTLDLNDAVSASENPMSLNQIKEHLKPSNHKLEQN